jgi:xanthine dehydrogenase accessory factor
MRELVLWEFVAAQLAQVGGCALLIVTASTGSSPGRPGFKMAVASDGSMVGSIGGGIMEHKLVEYVQNRLASDQPCWELRRQIHSKDAAHDQSGMICSGEQSIALLGLTAIHLQQISTIIAALRTNNPMRLEIDAQDLRASHDQPYPSQRAFQYTATDDWQYTETLGIRAVAHVVGAGHVGIEMCRVLHQLDFHVINYDDRPDLNTMQANAFAHQKIVVPYPEIGQFIPENPSAYVIVMTFGYRGDDMVVRALLGRRFAYFGMMGSNAKVEKLLADLRKDGFAEEAIQTLRTPAGLIAHCKTPAEIAVSIAAEIIALRNDRA